MSSKGDDASSFSVQLQVFEADSSRAGPQVQVNDFVPGAQDQPRIATGPGDRFVIVWRSSGSPGTDSDGTSIQMQRFLLDLFSDGFEARPVAGVALLCARVQRITGPSRCSWITGKSAAIIDMPASALSQCAHPPGADLNCRVSYTQLERQK